MSKKTPDIVSSMRSWAKQYRIYKGSKNEKKPPTHLLLDGGKFHIPEKNYDKFLTRYSDDVAHGRPNYVCEIKTPVFKFLIDLDLFEPTAVTRKEIIRIMKEIQFVINAFYPHSPDKKKHAIICTTEPKKQIKDSVSLTKTGVHVIYPLIRVTTDQAKILRWAIVQHLGNIFGERPSHNPWTDVIDNTVYSSNGLRMIGSRKCSICKNCKGKRSGLDEYCDDCNDTGKIDEGRVYNPTMIMDSKGKLLPQELKNLTFNVFEMIRTTSIVCYNKESTEMIKDFPDWYTEITFEYNESDFKTRPKKYPFGEQLTKEDEEGEKELHLSDKTLILNDKNGKGTYTKIRNFIVKKMPKVYKNLEIRDIHKVPSEPHPYYIVRTNNQFCMNVAKNHNSNTIYFLINEHGLYQKCWCRCTHKTGKYGTCKEYHSERKPLSNTIQKELYPFIKTQTTSLYSPKVVYGSPDDPETIRRREIYECMRLRELAANHLSGRSAYEKQFDDF